MKSAQQSGGREIMALKVHQWLNEWERVKFDDSIHRHRPDSHFYVFTISASELKALSGIYRRTIKGGLLRSQDLGIQRRHDQDRSNKIYEFIKYGYPWSDLSDAKRESGQFDDLRKPGWLPTAIVVNILKPSDERRGQKVAKEDTVRVIDSGESTATVKLPQQFTGLNWRPSQLPPIEVIDGQHRLWAFEQGTIDDDFELPVVAFHGLDISWQAYLFWSINITPKRINASLAFDLYPLLRTEDWLEKFEGHSIYRETRAQELTEALWAHQESPWHHRINMLGETGLKEQMVSQAAWIRSLMATYVKLWERGGHTTIGGLFGATLGSHKQVLMWSRAQQAAFLILMGQKILSSIENCQESWARALRESQQPDLFGNQADPAFYGPHTLLNTDQGIRGILYVTNDLCYVRVKQLELEQWMIDEDAGAVDEKAVSEALKSLRKQKVDGFLGNISVSLAKYDWRTASAGNLSDEEKTRKLAFRGSGGYKELRRQLLLHIAGESGDVGKAARDVLKALEYKQA